LLKLNLSFLVYLVKLCHLVILLFVLGHANPFDNILTSLKVGKEDLKYYDLTKLEDSRYGICYLIL